MGEVVTRRELGIKLLITPEGVVNPRRVGFANLDRMVELHLMAVPLRHGEDERIGLAGIGRGWSYVDTSSDSPAIIRATTAHEVAHGFGFLIPGSKQEDPESPFHCCDGNCVMHRSVVITTHEPVIKVPTRGQRIKSRISRRSVEPVIPRETYSVDKQYDFCLPCKIDLRDNGSQNISKLRYNRVIAEKKI